jgi:hypothetical protein
MEALTRGEAMRRYARQWPLTHACMTILIILGAEAVIEPVLKLWHLSPDQSYAERVGIAIVVGAAITAMTRNWPPQSSRSEQAGG